MRQQRNGNLAVRSPACLRGLAFAMILLWLAGCRDPKPAQAMDPAPVTKTRSAPSQRLTLPCPGMSAAEIEHATLLAIEDVLRNQPEVTRVMSTAADGLATVEIHANHHATHALARAVDTITTFPDDCEEPRLVTLRPDTQRRRFVWTTQRGDVDLRKTVAALSRDLERLEKVVDAQVMGASHALYITPDTTRLRGLGLTHEAIKAAIETRTLEAPGRGGIRPDALTAASLAALLLTKDGVTLGDVATLELAVREGTRVLFDGRPAVVLEIRAEFDDWAPVRERVRAWQHPLLDAPVYGPVDPNAVVELSFDSAGVGTLTGDGASPYRVARAALKSMTHVLMQPSTGDDDARLMVLSKTGPVGLMDVLEVLERQPGLTFRVRAPHTLLQRVAVHGTDLDVIDRVAEHLATLLEADACVRHTYVPSQRPEWHLDIREDQARVLGLSTHHVARVVRDAMTPKAVVVDQDPPVIWKRDALAPVSLTSLHITTPRGDVVPLSDVASLTLGTRPRAIHRVDGRRTQWIEVVRAATCREGDVKRRVDRLRRKQAWPKSVEVVVEVDGLPRGMRAP